MARITDLQALQREVCTALQAALDAALPDWGVEVCAAYGGKHRPLPLRRPMVAVGFTRLRAAGGGEQYLGEDGPSTLTARPFAVELGLQIAVPRTLDGEGAYTVFQAVADCLLLGAFPFAVGAVACGEVSHRPELDCFGAAATAELQVLLYTERAYPLFERFEVRRI